MDGSIPPGRYIAHLPDRGGEVEVLVTGPAPPDQVPEGGGEDLVIPHVWAKHDGERLRVTEAAIVREA